MPALSNGRENFRSPVNATPGTSRDSTNGLPSDSGSSAIRCSSITCPDDAELKSSSGVALVTEIVSSMPPSSSARSSVSRSPTRTSMPLPLQLLEARQLRHHVVNAGRQERQVVDAVAVGDARRRLIGRRIRGGDRGARQHGVRSIRHAAGDRAAKVLSRRRSGQGPPRAAPLHHTRAVGACQPPRYRGHRVLRRRQRRRKRATRTKRARRAESSACLWPNESYRRSPAH